MEDRRWKEDRAALVVFDGTLSDRGGLRRNVRVSVGCDKTMPKKAVFRSSLLNFPSSILHPRPSILYLLSSIFHLLSSASPA